MIKLLDINKNVLHLITKVKDYYIDSDLRTGDKLLSFSIPRIDPAAASLKQELYLRTATDEYVIKEINYLNRDFTEVFAKLNLDGLKSVRLRNFDSTGKNLSTFLTSALAGTGWTFQLVDAITKLRTVRAEESTVFDLIAEASKVYNIEPEFDTLNKVVKIYQTRGTDRGAYAFTDLNIKSADFQSDTYDLVTRIYPYGADGLTIAAVNNGVTYVEDFSFTDKVVEYHWVDERYTDAATLKEDAINKLTALCKPRVSIKLAVLDLARVSNQYSYLDYRLGDLITVLDKSAKQVYHERIMRLTEYPLEPERNVVEMSNTMLSFAEMQKEASKNVENIVTSISVINKDLSNFDAAVNEVSEMIKSGYGGYVVTRYNAENQPYEILILDNPDLLLAQNVIRLSANGLAFSTTGYNGTYDTAITIDGRILGRFIDTASLSAISSNLGEITAGTIDANLVTVKNIKAEHITLGSSTTYEPGYNPTIVEANARTYAEQQADAALLAAQQYADGELSDYATLVNGTLDSLQAQVDGSITTWFYNYVPTNTNIPATSWTTVELKNNHLGDLFYDTISGYCYRWQVANNIYSWSLVKDTDVTKALEDASKAQDTADGKRRVFSATPAPPYDLNDLWVQGTSGDIMRCKVARTTGNYIATDWIKASKYTDDTRAISAESNAKAYADTTKAAAEVAAKEYADLQIAAEQLRADIYADGVKTDAEAYALAQAIEKRDEAKIHAEEKAQAAEAAAKEYADLIESNLTGQINVVVDAVTTNTNEISELGTTITSETTIDGIPLKTYTADLSAKQLRFTESLGVINLFKNSSDNYQEISFTDRTFLQPIAVGGTSPLQPNNSITLSAYVTTTNKGIAIGVKQSALSGWGGETMWGVDEEGATVYIPPYSEGVLRITCLISPEADHIEPMFYSGDLVEETTVLYKEMMLTLGTSLYPWTPYLGDIAQVASNAAIGVVDGALMTTVNAEQYAQDLAAIGAFLKGELTAAQAADGKDESVGAVVQGLDAWVYAVKELESVTGSHDTTVGDIIKFFKFDTNFLTIGKSTSNLKINITNEAVNFIEGSTKIAWISGQQLNIKSAVIYDDAEIIDIRWSRMEGHTVLTWAGA